VYNPFNVMHDQGVKKQLYLLFQVFSKIKEGDKLMAERDATSKQAAAALLEDDDGISESFDREDSIGSPPL
jgi:hypothetical protein